MTAHKSILLTTPPILLLAFIGYNRALDIQLYDTYLVFATIHIGLFFSSFLAIVGLLYWLARNRDLVKWMTIIHVTTTISIFLMVMLCSLIFKKITGSDFDTFATCNQILLALILVAAYSQLVFVVNLVIGWSRPANGNE